MPLRRRLLSAAVTPLVIGVAASAAGAAPRPPALSHHRPAVAARTATVVTELSARETPAGAASTVRVKGRLVEGDTLLFPLARLAVSVEVSGEADAAPQRCNTTTSREGRFTCVFRVTPRRMTEATVTFRGNALFAPGKATTTIAADPPGAAPAPAPSGVPSADAATTAATSPTAARE
ncbi:hypothetical protein [Streptomyces sp. NPDC046939]|uniref:hypothetical protein n=1 Tax=Streptomyces sp. NPDC046939 TaxID=3155376 RepID=UPI00340DAB34